MIYLLDNGQIRVSVSDLGAEVVSVIKGNKERVWQNQNGLWSDHSPILYPVCGNSAVIIDGKDYKMPFHGFARKSVFTLKKNQKNLLVFELSYNEQTYKIYPFKFLLEIVYTINGNSLIIENTIKNVGDKPMRFAFGRHDSFNLDMPVDNYVLSFEKDEHFLSQRCNKDRKIINVFDDLGSGRRFYLSHDHLSKDRTIIFGNIGSRSVLLETVDGKRIAGVHFSDISNLLLWRAGQADMICIEPWSALPDDENAKDFTKNEKYYLLPSGKKRTFDFSITYY